MEYNVSTISWVTKEQMTELIMAHMKYSRYRPPTRSSFVPIGGVISASPSRFDALKLGSPRPGQLPSGYRPHNSSAPTGWPGAQPRDNWPTLDIRQQSDLGQSQQDFFFWKRSHVLVVTGDGSSHKWIPLLPGWDNPHMAHTPAVSLGRVANQRPTQVPISSMTTAEKVGQAMFRSMKPEYMSAELSNVVLGLVTPEAIGQMLAIEAVYTVSMFFGVGEVATALLVVLGTYYVGEQVVELLNLLKDFVSRVTNARTDLDIEESAKLFARIMTMGSQLVVSLLTRTRSRAHGNHTVLRMKSGRGGGNTGHTPGGSHAGAGSLPGSGGRPSPGGGTGHTTPVPTPKPKSVPRRKRKPSTQTRDQRAKTNTDNLDTRRGGHSKGKHGTQVTPKQHEDRLRTGRDPQTGQIEYGKNGKSITPKNSSGFDNNQKHLEALGKADKELKSGLSTGKYIVDSKGRVQPPVVVDVPNAGTSHSLNPPKTGSVITQTANQAKAIYQYNPKTGGFDLVTLYPIL